MPVLACPQPRSAPQLGAARLKAVARSAPAGLAPELAAVRLMMAASVRPKLEAAMVEGRLAAASDMHSRVVVPPACPLLVPAMEGAVVPTSLHPRWEVAVVAEKLTLHQGRGAALAEAPIVRPSPLLLLHLRQVAVAAVVAGASA